MFPHEDDYEERMPPIKTEVFGYDQSSTTRDYGIKSEASNSFDYDQLKSDDQSRFGSEFITSDSVDGNAVIFKKFWKKGVNP